MDNALYQVIIDVGAQSSGETSFFDLGDNFPENLITGQSFDLEITVVNGVNDVSLAGATGVLSIVANNTTQTPIVLDGTGVIATNTVTFTVDKDLIPESLAAFPQSDQQPAILLFAVVEDADSKLEFRKLITIFDENGEGSGSSNPPSSDFAYTPTTAADWLTFISVAPVTVSEGLDDLAAEVANKEATLTDAANIAWNVFQQKHSVVTLTASRILDNPTNLKAGGVYRLRVIQGGAGSFVLTYGTAYDFPGGTAPTLTTAVGAVDLLTFYSDGTNMLLESVSLDIK